MLGPGASRREIVQILQAAYADGLLSQETLCRRLDQVLDARIVDPMALIGDLNLRRSRRSWHGGVTRATVAAKRVLRLGRTQTLHPRLLALDWSGARRELLVGRYLDCDVVLSSPGVSRHHARLLFRDGSWVLRDLGSTNGTIVNGVRVGRCELLPGDQLIIGGEQLTID